MKTEQASAVWRALLAGNKRFCSDRSTTTHRTADHRATLVKAQHPVAAVLDCSDSRVVPELIFDVGLGDIFTVSTAGLALDSAVVGSLEYAVTHLHVPLVVLLAHTECGALAATSAERTSFPTHLGTLVDTVACYLADSRADSYQHPSDKNAVSAAQHLLDVSAPVRAAHAQQQVGICAARYQIDDGVVHETAWF